MAEAIVENTEEMGTSADTSTATSGGGPASSLLNTRNIILLGVIGAIMLFLVARVVLAPKYHVLFTNLAQSDAAAISSYLEKQKIKFKISPEGEKIEVAGISAPKLRLELASKGLPRGSGVGFEIFDKTNINISDFNQKINYNRALEGELSRTIS
ncbi:MAG: hypothetical protein OXU45_06680, partial [Candidatus Melainabacteria bacterium]|nr:hypothetical protein [Candidatus Melainabacteria bacterium]